MQDQHAQQDANGQDGNGVFDSMVLSQAQQPRKNPFETFKELMERFPVRSSYGYKGNDPFFSRWVSARAGSGVAIRWSCAAHSTTRSENDVADSAASGYGLFYVASGGVQVVQRGQEIEAEPGKAIIYDLDAPCQVNMREGRTRDFTFVSIPREVPGMLGVAGNVDPLVLNKLRIPLLSCIQYLSQVLSAKRGYELDHVYKACASLVSAELISAQQDDSSHARSSRASTALLRRMLAIVEREPGNAELSPEWLAQRFGISVRYVHKLFARDGLTCRAHINEVRLENARRDLASSPGRIHLATLAYRWGFSDPSSFGRAFRNRFGCSPGKFRSDNEA
jgi:AraC family transcriptional activator of tynA and feaB